MKNTQRKKKKRERISDIVELELKNLLRVIKSFQFLYRLKLGKCFQDFRKVTQKTICLTCELTYGFMILKLK